MTIDPVSAVARAEFQGSPVYFCSQACHRRFLENPEGYLPVLSPRSDGGRHCGHRAWNPRALAIAFSIGVPASAILLGFYFGALTWVSGWAYTAEQFGDYWPFIVALAVGFGLQVGFFVYLRRAVHAAASGKVVAATGTTSGAAMVSCCTHYLVNLLPILGATSLVTFIGQYQTELFWFGIAANLAGIAYMGRRLISFTQGA